MVAQIVIIMRVEINKMKTATILLIVLTVGLLITGCSKTTPTTQTSTLAQTDTATTTDISVDTTSSNPDIGTLDDTAVSEEIPQ
jgi:PBP1b-binding outer membrane lipoprotein LpoB